jgi:hypothetical protein
MTQVQPISSAAFPNQISAFTSDSSSLYDRDFQLWIENTTKLLREQKFTELDLENLIEEIEGMGKSQRSAVRSNLTIVLLHLLKWNYQPEKQTNSWKASIREHRIRLERDFEDSPSLKNYCQGIFVKTYQDSRKLAADEMGLELKVLPTDSPFTLIEVLDSEFLPRSITLKD